MATISTKEAEKMECIYLREFKWCQLYLLKKHAPTSSDGNKMPNHSVPRLIMLKNIDEVETAVWEGENVSYQFRYHRDTGACWFAMQIHAHYAAPAESLFEFFIPPKERDFLTILSILDTI